MAAVKQIAATPSLAAAQVYASSGGTVRVGTGYLLSGFTLHVGPAAVAAGSELGARLTVPPDARIQSALFELLAEPVTTSAAVGSVADVRSTTPVGQGFTAAAVIDFGRLVTVGGIVDPQVIINTLDIGQVQRWNGSQWSFVANGPAFAELATERLLVQSTSGTGDALVQRLTQSAGIVLPAPPAGLELLVDGRTVWFQRQGSSPVEVDAPQVPAPGGVRFVVDRTDAVREAFARAQAGRLPGDPTPLLVQVALQVTTPGRLVLRPQLRTLRTSVQEFPPEGLTHTADLAEEGQIEVVLTPPLAQAVHEVDLVVRGRFGPERVAPAVGPPITDAARLVLTASRSILVGLPRSVVSRFTTVRGVRLHLAATTTSGGQLSGRLLAAPARDRPGDPIDGGESTPLTVTDPDAAWHTLQFVRPVRLAPGGDDLIAAWLELSPGYGELECGLTLVPPGGALRRRLSGGGTGTLTTIAAIGPLQAALRIVGTPDRDHPLAAVALSLAGAPEVIDVDPTADNLVAVLTPATPVSATPQVRLVAVCSAPGSLVLDTVRVTFRELPEGTA